MTESVISGRRANANRQGTARQRFGPARDGGVEQLAGRVLVVDAKEAVRGIGAKRKR